MPNQTDLSSYNNDWYKPGSAIKRGLWYVANVSFLLNPMFPFSRAKIALLRIFGATIGKGVVIKPGVNIKYPWLLEIKDHCWIGEKVWIDNLAQVSIGNNVCLSQGAMLLCGNHNYRKKTFDLMVEPIILEDGVWIGAQALVCPGVVCKTHSVLSVKSVATQDLLSYKIYRGIPAQIVKDRTIED